MLKYFAALLLFISCVTANRNNTLGMSEANPASSCNEIYQHNPTSRGGIDQYWIKTSEGLIKVKCNTHTHTGS